MNTDRLVIVVAALVVVLLVAGLAVIRPLVTDDEAAPGPTPAGGSSAGGRAEPAAAERTAAPVVDGRRLRPLPAADRPPAPKQWDAGAGGVPSATWWSSAVVGPGATSLWPQPLALAISKGGEVQVAAPRARAQAGGGVEAPFIPAVVLEPGASASTTVVDQGPLHVRLALRTGGRSTELTLVQGSPAVEVRASDPFDLRAPGLDLAPGRHGSATGLVFATSEGAWAIGSEGATITAGPDVLHVVPGPSGRLAFGPVPAGAAGAEHVARLATLSAHPLVRTEESVEVADDGTTSQVLTQVRSGAPGPVSLWALQPHHQRYAVRPGSSVGTVPSALGSVPVVVAEHLRLEYPAVPILWSAVPVPGGDDAIGTDRAVADEGAGSYFGGKAAYAAAARGDALSAAGDAPGAKAATAEARRRLDDLVDPDRSPSVRWEAQWGSVVMEPAEFGSGTDLNDHGLQYGYWVAAASHVVEADPSQVDRYRSTIDLLIADFAGAATLPGSSAALAPARTWSPYEGHSWASGTAPFGAGNNLESSSESSFAWWAAARWMVATGRSAGAEPFIARFTIESALAGISWLPDGDRLPSDAAIRPWSGVVWSGKIDPGTWFDPQDESALGIRLLPLGPAALARYPSARAVDAAVARWRWCDDRGDGCRTRWANLLDSDAAVAGLGLRTGPDPEPSTAVLLSAWWRDLWDRTSLAEGWSCSVGVVARRADDGSVVVLASNPGPAVTLSCRDGAGVERWSERVSGTRTGLVRASR